MDNKRTIKGVLLVALGASSYGMLATFVKLAYGEGYTTAEVTSSQFLLGVLGLLLINSFRKLKQKKAVAKPTPKNIRDLLLAGTSTGLTGIFYYSAVKYVPVSIGIVLLMQTVWMGVVLEYLLDKKRLSLKKVAAVAITLLGTVLATNILKNEINLDWRGLLWGLLAAASFTATMFTANRVAVTMSTPQRSLYMLVGGTVIVLAFTFFTQTGPYNFMIFTKWAIVLSLFGTIIPPILMNAGFPLTGIGLGSIVSALELPVSVFMAFLVLHEKVIASQWFGIALIIFAIFIMNKSHLKKS